MQKDGSTKNKEKQTAKKVSYSVHPFLREMIEMAKKTSVEAPTKNDDLLH